jgi:hypothetical protein
MCKGAERIKTEPAVYAKSLKLIMDRQGLSATELAAKLKMPEFDTADKINNYIKIHLK